MSVEDAVISQGAALAVQEPLAQRSGSLVEDANGQDVHLDGEGEPKLEDAAVREDHEPYGKPVMQISQGFLTEH